MENFGKNLAALIAICIAIVAFANFFGWLTMLSVGAVHSIFDWPQTISYIQGIQLAGVIFLLGWILDLGNITNKSK